jgi:hypothetical protein
MKMFYLLIFLTISIFAEDVKKWEVNTTKVGDNLDMVYSLDFKKFPKFVCEGKLKNGESVKFVSVKAMMQVFEHQDYFKKHKLLSADIEKLYVKDYLDGTKIEAKKALYMFGSRLVGPHGDDLIPLKDQNSAKLFKLKYGGTKLLPYEKLSKGLIKYLDM